ncbi:MAG: hypothetical protein NTZ34_05055, partial [Chloroflexi bacterium]|nr:hypothetical protein [Chloroflexota bacterium]
GTVSGDGNTLISIVYTFRSFSTSTSTDFGTAESEYNNKVELKNMPLTSPSSDAIKASFWRRGVDIQNYVSKMEDSNTVVRNGKLESSRTFFSRDWTWPDTQLEITFE